MANSSGQFFPCQKSLSGEIIDRLGTSLSMLLCLVSLCASISPNFEHLAKKARDDMQRRKTLSFTREHCLPAGSYTQGMASFTLSTTFCSTDDEEILGEAHDTEFAAIISRNSTNLRNRTTISVPNEEQMYELGEVVDEDESVTVFMIQTVNFRDVFDRFQLSTVSSSSAVLASDIPITCPPVKTIPHVQNTGDCKASLGINWDQPAGTKGANGTPKMSSLGIGPDGSQVGIGTYMDITFLASIKYEKNAAFTVELKFQPKADSKFWLDLKKGHHYQITEDKQVATFSTTLYSNTWTIKGHSVPFQIDFQSEIVLKSLDASLPFDLDFRDAWRHSATAELMIGKDATKCVEGKLRDDFLTDLVAEPSVPGEMGFAQETSNTLKTIADIHNYINFSAQIDSHDIVVEAGSHHGVELDMKMDYAECVAYPGMHGKYNMYSGRHFNVNPKQVLDILVYFAETKIIGPLVDIIFSIFDQNSSIAAIKDNLTSATTSGIAWGLRKLGEKWLTRWEWIQKVTDYKWAEHVVPKNDQCLLAVTSTPEDNLETAAKKLFIIMSDYTATDLTDDDVLEVSVRRYENAAKYTENHPAESHVLFYAAPKWDNNKRASRMLVFDQLGDSVFGVFVRRTNKANSWELRITGDAGIAATTPGIQELTGTFNEGTSVTINMKLNFGESIKSTKAGLPIGAHPFIYPATEQSQSLITLPVQYVEEGVRYAFVGIDNTGYSVFGTNAKGIDSSTLSVAESLQHTEYQTRHSARIGIVGAKHKTQAANKRYTHVYIHRCKYDNSQDCVLAHHFSYEADGSATDITAEAMQKSDWYYDMNLDRVFCTLDVTVEMYEDGSTTPVLTEKLPSQETTIDWVSAEDKTFVFSSTSYEITLKSRRIETVPSFLQTHEVGGQKPINGLTCREFTSTTNGKVNPATPTDSLSIDINMYDNERYGVLLGHYNIHEDACTALLAKTADENTYLYALVSMSEGQPLTPASKASDGDEWYIVYIPRRCYERCTYKDIAANLVISIPFMRPKANVLNTKWTIQRLIASDNGGMCYHTINIPTWFSSVKEKNIPCGCLEDFRSSGTTRKADDAWIAGYHIDETTKNTVTDEDVSFYKEGATWKLRSYRYTSKEEDVHGPIIAKPRSSTIDIRENEITISIPAEDNAIYAQYGAIHQTKADIIRIECARAHKVVVTNVDYKVLQTIEKKSGVLWFNPREYLDTDIVLMPVGAQDSTYCRIDEPASMHGPNDYYLAIYGKDEGVYDLRPADFTGTRMRVDVTKQILEGGDYAYWKSWEGEVSTTPLNKGTLQIIIKPSNNPENLRTVWLSLGSTVIPFSPNVMDKSVLKAIGITVPDNPDDTVVSYTEDGTLLVNANYFEYERGTDKELKNKVNMVNLLNLPNSYVTKVDWECDETDTIVKKGKCVYKEGGTPRSFPGLAIAGIVIGAIVCIGSLVCWPLHVNPLKIEEKEIPWWLLMVVGFVIAALSVLFGLLWKYCSI